MKSVVGILDLERYVAHAVAMLLYVLSRWMLRRERRRQDKVYAVLPQQVARRLAIAGFESRIGCPRKPERLAVIKLGLLRISNIKLNMMNFLQPKRVLNVHTSPTLATNK